MFARVNALIRSVTPAAFRNGVAHVLCSPFVGRFLSNLFNNKIPAQGNVILVDSPRIANETKAAIFWKLYEWKEMEFAMKYIEPHDNVIELGGSIGVIACQIAKKLTNSSQFVIVEADPDLVALLNENLAHNCPKNNYHTIPKAVYYSCRTPESVEFSIKETNLGGRVKELENREVMRTITVPVVKLSELIWEHQIRDYVLICDIEGAEIGLLLYDHEALKNCKKLIVELHPGEFEGKIYDLADLIKMIEACGFSVIDRRFHRMVFKKHHSCSKGKK